MLVEQMRIYCCPKCGKAGLYYANNSGSQKWLDPEYKHHLWCPRCKEWVKPIVEEFLLTPGNPAGEGV
ncbi:hypothetical protein ES707_21469 [subsurface metagenome]